MGNNLSGFPKLHEGSIKDLTVDIQNSFSIKEELVGSRLLRVAKVIVLNAPNTIGFLRDYVYQSLLERLSTRPFLIHEEKLWICFQILKSLEQLHAVDLCHGDLKMENFLITGWGWVFLTDPAPYKTVHLPSDNPSEFTYLFDNSRRRACYLAPERFYDSDNMKTSLDETGVDIANEMENVDENLSRPVSTTPASNYLVPEMDLFSAGCIILELFSDGIVPFTLSDLLIYRSGSDSRIEKLLSINFDRDDAILKDLIIQLLSRDASQRKSAHEHLAKQKSKLFPDIFYGPFYAFMQSFLIDNRLHNFNHRLAYIFEKLSEILLSLKDNEKDLKFASILLVNLVTDCLKPFSTEGKTLTSPMSNGSLFCNQNERNQMKNLEEASKIKSIISLGLLSENLTCVYQIDRILPYLLDFVSNQTRHSSEVRVYALDTAGEILLNCHRILSDDESNPEREVLLKQLSDFNLLAEYLMRIINRIKPDDDILIRLSIVRNLPVIIDLSFLIYMNLGTCKENSVGNETQTYSQMQANRYSLLKNQIRERVVLLFEDSSVTVRQALVESTIAPSQSFRKKSEDRYNSSKLVKIAAFLGRHWTSNVLLSHLIAFFNEKNASELRVAFYQQIPCLIRYSGIQSISLIRPMLDQGLQDSNIFVIEQSIKSITELLVNDLFSGNIAIDYFQRIVAFAIHPVQRIRMSAINYVVVFSTLVTRKFQGSLNLEHPDQTNPLEIFTPGSIYARLSNDKAKSIFKKPIKRQITNEKYLMKYLRKPLSESLINNFIKHFIQSAKKITNENNNTNITELFDNLLEYLKDKYFPHLLDSQPIDLSRINLSPIREIIGNLKEIGVNDLRLSQLTILGEYLKTLLGNQLRCGYQQTTNDRLKITLDRDSITLLTRKLKKISINNIEINNQKDFNGKFPISQHPLQTPLFLSSAKSVDQSTRFFAEFEDQMNQLKYDLSLKLSQDQLCLRMEPRIKLDVLSPHPLLFYGRLFSIKYDQTDPKSPNEFVMRTSISTKTDTFTISTNSRSNGRKLKQYKPIKGAISGHVHEHDIGQVKLAVNPKRDFFVSTSSGDGMIKFWFYHQTSSFGKNVSINNPNNINTGQQHNNRGIHYLPFCSKMTIDMNSERYENTRNSSEKLFCQGSSWINFGDQLASLFNHSEMKLIDSQSGKVISSFNYEKTDHGKISCFTTPFTTSTEVQGNFYLASPGGSGGINPLNNGSNTSSDWNTIAMASSTDILLYDTRCRPENYRILKQSNSYGLITCLAIHSNQSWLVTGTLNNYLMFSDLRYHRPIKIIKHSSQKNIGIKFLRIYETKNVQGTNSSLVLVGHTNSLEISIFDTEISNGTSCKPFASAGVECQRLSMSKQSVNCLLPMLSNHEKGSQEKASSINLPNLLSGGSDCHIRNWQFSSIAEGNKYNPSGILAWSGFDESNLPNITSNIYSYDNRIVQNLEYPEGSVNYRLIDSKLIHSSQTVSGDLSKLNPNKLLDPNPQRGSHLSQPSANHQLTLTNPSTGHLNAISDMSIITTPNDELFLVSSSCDGVIKFWK